MIALPIYLQMVLEYNAMEAGLSHRPAVAEHVRASRCWPGGGRASAGPPGSSGWGSRCVTVGVGLLLPDRAAGGLRLGARDPAA